MSRERRDVGQILTESEMETILSDSELKNMIFCCALRWIGSVIVYMKKSKTEFHPKIVACMNDLEDSIHETNDAKDIWSSYNDLVKTAKLHGIDIMDLPFHCFGRSFY